MNGGCGYLEIRKPKGACDLQNFAQNDVVLNHPVVPHFQLGLRVLRVMWPWLREAGNPALPQDPPHLAQDSALIRYMVQRIETENAVYGSARHVHHAPVKG